MGGLPSIHQGGIIGRYTLYIHQGGIIGRYTSIYTREAYTREVSLLYTPGRHILGRYTSQGVPRVYHGGVSLRVYPGCTMVVYTSGCTIPQGVP